MNINEIAKIMTRDKFIEEVWSKGCKYIGNFNGPCQKHQVSESECKNCAKEHIKNIKFKGEKEIMIDEKLWNQFLGSKLAVNCRTEDEAKEFLKYCDSKGLKWINGDLLLGKTEWINYLDSTTYSIEKRGLQYGGGVFCKSIGYEVITYQQLISKEPKQYYGDEILKMLREGKLEVGTIIIGSDVGKCIIDKIQLTNELIIKQIDGTTVPIGNLIYDEFTIKEKEYVKFDEARKTVKKFKYKTWSQYQNLSGVCRTLHTEYSSKEINQMLDEKAWEVE